MIKISDVQIYLMNEEKLKAYANITLGDCFLIRDLKVIKGHTGLFVALPAKKRKDGLFRDVAHPINQEMRDELEKTVLEAYEKAQSENPAQEDLNSESA